MRTFFQGPDGNPRWELIAGVLLGAASGYYLLKYQKPAKEIVYMEFVNEYLTKDNVKQIEIIKDSRSDVFNHRAEFET